MSLSNTDTNHDEMVASAIQALKEERYSDFDKIKNNYQKIGFDFWRFHLPQVDFSGQSFKDWHCGNVLFGDTSAQSSFEDAVFAGTHFTRTWFKNCFFSHAHFKDVLLGDHMHFENCDFRYAIFNLKMPNAQREDLKFERCKFEGADLAGQWFVGTTFRHCDFRGAKLDFANLAGADIYGSIFDAKWGPLLPAMLQYGVLFPAPPGPA